MENLVQIYHVSELLLDFQGDLTSFNLPHQQMKVKAILYEPSVLIFSRQTAFEDNHCETKLKFLPKAVERCWYISCGATKTISHSALNLFESEREEVVL